VRQEIDEQNKAIMTVIRTLREAKQVLESNLENLEEKRAASAEARSGKQQNSKASSTARGNTLLHFITCDKDQRLWSSKSWHLLFFSS